MTCNKKGSVHAEAGSKLLLADSILDRMTKGSSHRGVTTTTRKLQQVRIVRGSGGWGGGRCCDDIWLHLWTRKKCINFAETGLMCKVGIGCFMCAGFFKFNETGNFGNLSPCFEDRNVRCGIFNQFGGGMTKNTPKGLWSCKIWFGHSEQWNLGVPLYVLLPNKHHEHLFWCLV